MKEKEPNGSEGDTPATFDQWKEDPSRTPHVYEVELLSALAYGTLKIQSTDGSSIVLGRDFHVDSAGFVITSAALNIAHHRLLSDDIHYPDGPVQANFFQTDNVSVGQPFQLMTYDRSKGQSIVAILRKVAKLTIQPTAKSLVDDLDSAPA